jgi:hypothetical protein
MAAFRTNLKLCENRIAVALRIELPRIDEGINR